MLQIQWLWQFVLAILPVLLLWGAELVRILIKAQSMSFVTVIWGGVILFIYFVSYKAFQNKNLFEGIDQPDTSTLSPLDKSAKGERPAVITPTARDEKLIQQIQLHMEEQEPFLEASLSIQELADQINIPVRDLSLLINHKLNQHFFDFVNEYRIKKAMDLLQDPSKRKMTVLEILYAVGFNSKSSFNTVFKKYTGQTPSQFRKSGLALA